ncbi:MAG: SRPBCC family protein [bacterium]|nr:SRPBCC family protein [bacterium]
MSNTLRQIVIFKATPHAVYEALMDAKQHAKFTGGPAKISRKVGGAFSVFGGSIHGHNLKLARDKSIVQAWRVREWPKKVSSRVTFSLQKVKGGTRLAFVHTGVPAKELASIRKGWKTYYWEPMKELFKR